MKTNNSKPKTAFFTTLAVVLGLFNSLTSLAISPYEKEKIVNELSLDKNKSKFCAKGVGGLYTTIRSESGKYCDPNRKEGQGWGPYLARKICLQLEYKDPITKKKFSSTECGLKIVNYNESALDALAIKTISAADLCIFLQKFVTLDACKAGVLAVPKPQCPDIEELKNYFYEKYKKSSITYKEVISYLLTEFVVGNLRGSDIGQISKEVYAFAFDPKINKDFFDEAHGIEKAKYQINNITFNRVNFADDKCEYPMKIYVSNANKPIYNVSVFLKVRKRTKYKD